MRVRTFAQHIGRINSEEIPYLPPFKANQGLEEDELITLMKRATPNSWKKDMVKHNFDLEKTELSELLEFFERLENAEEHDTDSKTVQNTKSKQGSDNKRNKSSHGKSTKKEKGKWCDLHHSATHHQSHRFKYVLRY